MEQFFQNIWAYLQSPEFNAILTSGLAAYAVVRPVLNKILSIKGNSRLELAKAKIAKLTDNIEVFKAEAEEYKQTALNIKAAADMLISNACNQTEAMRLAFERSNLKEDTKAVISKLLPTADAVKSIADITPIENKVESVIEAVKETAKIANQAVNSEVNTVAKNAIIRDF